MFINKGLYTLAGKYIKHLCGIGCIDLVGLLLATSIMYLASLSVQMMLGGSIGIFSSVYQIYGLIFFVILLRYLIAQTKVGISNRVGAAIKYDVRKQLLSAFFDMGPAYTERRRSGDLSSVVWGRVEWLNNYYDKYFTTCFATILHAVILTAVLFYINVYIGLCAFICLFLTFVLPSCFSGLLNTYGSKEWSENSKYFSDCLDGLQGVTTLKSLNANAYQIKKIEAQGESLRKSIMKHLRISIFESCSLELCVYVGILATLLVSVWAYVHGVISAANLVLLLFLVLATFKPMFTLITAWHIGYRGVTAAQSIVEVLEDHKSVVTARKKTQQQRVGVRKPENEAHGCAVQVSSALGSSLGAEAQFNQVSFSYADSDEPVLDNCSFVLENDKMSALVGESGAGKSTISYLLAGFYEPDLGDVSILQNGRVFSDSQSRRSCISAVWQDTHIFYGSIADNIRMGKPDASEEELHEATKLANIHDFVMSLPEGYETLVGERGTRLSGGQRQRVALARASLRNAPVLIFDEATSALDRENEALIQKSLTKLAKGKTVLLITHRTEALSKADAVYILKNKQVVRDGE